MALTAFKSPDPKQLTEGELADRLSDIYNSASIGRYGQYFYLNHFNSVEFKAASGRAQGDPKAPFKPKKFRDYKPNVILEIQSIPALQTIPPFIGPGEPYHVFVSLEQYRLPFQTALLLSSTFRMGLVTRLVLEKYKSKWENLGIHLSLPLLPAPPRKVTSFPNPAVTVSTVVPPPAQPLAPRAPLPLLPADVWARGFLSSMTRSWLQPGTWTSEGKPDYEDCLSAMTDSTIQAAGMVTGWVAGDALVAAPGELRALEPKIWELFNAHHTTHHLGMMMGYTFCFLSGFVKSDRTLSMITGQSPDGQLRKPSNNGAVQNHLRTHIDKHRKDSTYKSDSVFAVANQFFRLVTGEVYAITQPDYTGNKAKALTNYLAFIQGFEQGLTQGADVMFSDLLEEGYIYGYKTGYANGFRDGYSQGYSAGWQAGYDYRPGQNTWMSGLENILSGVGSLLSSNNLTNILQDVEGVGQVIVSIF